LCVIWHSLLRREVNLSILRSSEERSVYDAATPNTRIRLLPEVPAAIREHVQRKYKGDLAVHDKDGSIPLFFK
jgi:hypothetical protein